MGAHHFPIVSHHFPVYIYILCKCSYIFFTCYQKVHFLKVIKMVVSSVSKPALMRTLRISHIDPITILTGWTNVEPQESRKTPRFLGKTNVRNIDYSMYSTKCRIYMYIKIYIGLYNLEYI